MSTPITFKSVDELTADECKRALVILATMPSERALWRSINDRLISLTPQYGRINASTEFDDIGTDFDGRPSRRGF
jgi:hypothetical protein